MKTTLETLGARNLRVWQECNRLNNTAFAEMVGVHPVHVTRWRRGLQRPKDDMRLKIQQITNGEVSCGDWSIPYATDQR